jgi:protein-tyrosine phosphatase
MAVQPYWITPQLAIVPRPQGADRLVSELTALKDAGIEVLVSMLEPHEARELGLAGEDNAASRAGLHFVTFPVPDRGTPTDTVRFGEFLSELERHLRDGRRIGIHCRACIGRSSVVAASLMIRAGAKDEEAWRKIGNARGVSVPDTFEQRAWVEREIRQKPWHLI